MMTGNKPTSTGAPSENAPACAASVHDLSVHDLSVPWPSVRGRLEWIDERVEIVQSIIGAGSTDAMLLAFVLGTVEEFAELLRVHFAGVES